MFVASIRDYDALLMDKPPYAPPYIHKTEKAKLEQVIEVKELEHITSHKEELLITELA